jgi:hypothetical protein
MSESNSDTSLLGAAGEHFVMSELLRRGYIAALAPRGAPNADIVVTDVNARDPARSKSKHGAPLVPIKAGT